MDVPAYPARAGPDGQSSEAGGFSELTKLKDPIVTGLRGLRPRPSPAANRSPFR